MHNKWQDTNTVTSIYVFISVTILILIQINVYTLYVHASTSSGDNDEGPAITTKDPDLKLELIFNGLSHPTSMAFLGPDDILVTEKNSGTVQRIVNGGILNEPLLDVNVARKEERGMLGLAVARQN